MYLSSPPVGSSTLSTCWPFLAVTRLARLNIYENLTMSWALFQVSSVRDTKIKKLQAPITILKCSGSLAIQAGWQIPWGRDYASSLPGVSARSRAILDTEKWMKGLGCQKIRLFWDCKPKVLPLGVCTMLLPCSEKQKVGWTPGLCLGTTTNKVETQIPSQKYKPHKLC